MCKTDNPKGDNPSLRVGDVNSRPIKQVQAIGVDIEPSERFGWCYVFKDGICLGKVVWTEIKEAYYQINDVKGVDA